MDGLTFGQFTFPRKSRPESNVPAVTVTVAEPLCPSLVAVTVAVPALAPVTRPDALTVATAVLSLAQVTTRPVSGFPAAFRGVAVSGPV